MKTKRIEETVETVANQLRGGEEMTKEQEDELAASAVEAFGSLLVSIDRSLKKIAEKL